MLFVETGSARITTIDSAQEATAVSLDAGMAMAIPAEASQRLRSVNRNGVTVLLYSAPANPPPNFYSPPGTAPNSSAPAVDIFDGPDAEMTQAVLWQGTLAEVGWDRVHRAGRLALPAGAVVDLVPAPGTFVIVSVDDGAIEIGAPGGTISTLGADQARVESGPGVPIDAAHAAFVDANGEISLRNTSEHPVALLLIAIDPTPVAPDRRLSS
jgi:hypothetical protein